MRVNTAIVRSRSRYSSMSRLMNVGELCEPARPAPVEGSEDAVRYNGSSRSTTASTISSNAHIEMRLMIAETFTET